jgi:hypothetical protein
MIQAFLLFSVIAGNPTIPALNPKTRPFESHFQEKDTLER